MVRALDSHQFDLGSGLAMYIYGLVVWEHMSRNKVPWDFCEKSKPPI